MLAALLALCLGSDLAALGSDSFAARDAASARLAAAPGLVRLAVAHLGWRHPDPEVRDRSERLTPAWARAVERILADPARELLYGPGRVVETVPDVLGPDLADRVNARLRAAFGPDLGLPIDRLTFGYYDGDPDGYGRDTARLARQFRANLRGLVLLPDGDPESVVGHTVLPGMPEPRRLYNPWAD